MRNRPENIDLRLRLELDSLYERLRGRDQELLWEAMDQLDQLEIDLANAQDDILEREETIAMLEDEVQDLRDELDSLETDNE